jgi:hypothetical protein
MNIFLKTILKENNPNLNYKLIDENFNIINLNTKIIKNNLIMKINKILLPTDIDKKFKKLIEIKFPK